jgi:Sushi repeat (SCR repeat)
VNAEDRIDLTKQKITAKDENNVNSFTRRLFNDAYKQIWNFCDSIDNRCIAAPWVANAAGVLIQRLHLFIASCFVGYRFPDGEVVKWTVCHGDGTWDYLPNCDGE